MNRMDYKTAFGTSPADLDSSVATLLGQGYKPYEQPYGIQLAGGTGYALFQAMIRPEGANPFPLQNEKTS